MQRRNFLQSTGVLLPAVLLFKQSVFASEGVKSNKIGVLLVNTSTATNHDKVVQALQSASTDLQVYSSNQVAEITFNGRVFVVRTNDGNLFNTSKVVFNGSYTVDAGKMAVQVNPGEENLSLAFNSGKNKKLVRPEMWATPTGKIKSETFNDFLRRKANAFMCMS